MFGIFSTRDKCPQYEFHFDTSALSDIRDLLQGKVPQRRIDITSMDSSKPEWVTADPNAPKPRNVLLEILETLNRIERNTRRPPVVPRGRSAA